MPLFTKASATPLLTDSTQRAPRWWMLLLIGLIAGAVYLNSIPNEFAFDDCGIIQGNHYVTNLEWTTIWSNNYWPSPEGPSDLLYRPLTIFSYLANHALAPAPWTFHLINVLLHVIVAMLVSMLTWRILRHRWMALLAGALFAVHPLHTEVVANVVGRAELLAALWSLLTLLLFLPDQDPLCGPPPTRVWWHGILVAVCFLGAMLSKETPAALIGALLFLDFWRWTQWPAGRPTLWTWFKSQLLRYHLPIAIAFGIYMALRIHAIGLMIDTRAIHPLVNPLSTASMLERIVTPFLLLAKYIGLMIWPAVLSADYSAPSLMPTANIFQPQPLIGLLIVLAGVAAVITYWKSSPRLVALVVLFASSYLLVANVIRIGTIFGERLFYWPSVFFLMMVSYAMVRLCQRLSALPNHTLVTRMIRPMTVMATLVVLALAGYRTIVRNPDWHDNIALALATAQGNPSSAKACSWAGAVLVSETKEKWTKDFGESLLQRSIDLYPTMGTAYWDLTKYYFREGRVADALIEMGQAARYHGGSLEMRRALKMVNTNLLEHPASAYLPAVEKLVAKEPKNAMAHFSYGLALRAQNKNDLAAKQFSLALDNDPIFGEADAELGLTKGFLGDFPGAVYLLRQYVLNSRYNGIARCDLAGALLELDPAQYPGAMNEAQMNIERARVLLPDDVEVRHMMALMEHKKSAARQKAAGRPVTGSVAVADHP